MHTQEAGLGNSTGTSSNVMLPGWMRLAIPVVSSAALWAAIWKLSLPLL